MAGLALRVGGFGGVGSTDAPAMGTEQSYNTVTQAAFGPGVTVPASKGPGLLHPGTPHGMAFWVGVGCVIGLIVIRQSLPA